MCIIPLIWQAAVLRGWWTQTRRIRVNRTHPITHRLTHSKYSGDAPFFPYMLREKQTQRKEMVEISRAVSKVEDLAFLFIVRHAISYCIHYVINVLHAGVLLVINQTHLYSYFPLAALTRSRACRALPRARCANVALNALSWSWAGVGTLAWLLASVGAPCLSHSGSTSTRTDGQGGAGRRRVGRRRRGGEGRG